MSNNNFEVTNTFIRASETRAVPCIRLCDSIDQEVVRALLIYQGTTAHTLPTVKGGILTLSDTAKNNFKVRLNDIIGDDLVGLDDGFSGYMSGLYCNSSPKNKKVKIFCNNFDCGCPDGSHTLKISVEAVPCVSTRVDATFTVDFNCSCNPDCSKTLQQLEKMIKDDKRLMDLGFLVSYDSANKELLLEAPFDFKHSISKQLYDDSIIQNYYSGWQISPTKTLVLPSSKGSAALFDESKTYRFFVLAFRSYLRAGQVGFNQIGQGDFYGITQNKIYILVEDNAEGNAFLDALVGKLCGTTLTASELAPLSLCSCGVLLVSQPFCVTNADAGDDAAKDAILALLVAAQPTHSFTLSVVDRDEAAGETRYNLVSSATLSQIAAALPSATVVEGECEVVGDDTFE